MGSKRPLEDDGDNATKRRKEHAPSNPRKSGSILDQAYGQRGAFGTLENATTVPVWDSDLDCEDDSDALAYLRSVRVQASGIPHVLVAQKAGPLPPPTQPAGCTIKQEGEDEEAVDRGIYENGVGDSRGYYHDGAYTALPDDYNQDDDDDDDEEDEDEDGVEYDEDGSSDTSADLPHNSSSDEIRDAYFAALTRQYLSLRSILQTAPPRSAITCLPSSNPTQVGKLGAGSSTNARWTGLIKATDPLPAQIAAMRKDSVIRLLCVLLSSKSFREGYELKERTSRWIWALLARLPDRGELDYQEIGWIRELGKRAVLFMLNLAEREVLHKECGVGGGGGGEEEDGDVEADEGIHEEPTPSSQAEDPDVSIKEEADGSAGAQKIDHNKAGPISADADIKVECGSDPASQQAPAPPTDTKVDVEQGPVRSPSAPPRAEQDQEQDAAGAASDVEMQLDSDVEDGEVSEEPPQTKESESESEHQADIESAKARLLAQLEGAEEEPSSSTSSPEPELTQEQEEAARAQVNLRATLNMILTVAGEFYGQRDLLEFRNPFSRLSDD